MSIRSSLTYLADTNGVLPEYRSAFENVVGAGFSKAVILWDGPDPDHEAVIRLARKYANPDMERWLCFSSMGDSLELFHHQDAAREPGVENDGHTDLCGSYRLFGKPK